jgi:hypothetical protein
MVGGRGVGELRLVGPPEGGLHLVLQRVCMAGGRLHLVSPPDVAVLVLLVLALYDLHLVLDGLLVKDWADEVGHKSKIKFIKFDLAKTTFIVAV